MIRGLFLQRLYQLSDPQLEDHLIDRLSFRRFAGLPLDQRVPDFSTFWRFREELASDQLRPLPLSEGAERWATLYLATADPDTVGPGARRLVELIREAVATSATGDERIQQ